MKIEKLQAVHWPQVRAIYESGVATGIANFSNAIPGWDEWDNAHLKNCRIVAVEDDEVFGWAALTAISDRCVFAGVAEVSIYIAEKARGKGIGKKLLKELVKLSEENNFWTLESRIFSENLASIKIHQDNGFNIVGRRERIGQLRGTWRDLMLLERRSKIVGI